MKKYDKTFDVVALGELLVDFTENGLSPQGNLLMEANPGGDRDFSFCRNPGADMSLRAEEVDEELIAQARIFHFGSLSMTHPAVRAATKRAIEVAKKHQCLVSLGKDGSRAYTGSHRVQAEPFHLAGWFFHTPNCRTGDKNGGGRGCGPDEKSTPGILAHTRFPGVSGAEGEI